MKITRDKNQLFDFIAKKIAFTIDGDFSITSIEAETGGDISKCYTIKDQNNNHSFFVKTNLDDFLENFIAESEGLNAIAGTQTILTPNVIVYGHHLGYSFLVLDHFKFSNKINEYELGIRLAEFHKKAASKKFGFKKNNFIGSTLQENKFSDVWSEFWIENRICPQLNLAYSNGYSQSLDQLGKELIAAISELLKDHHPQPSLVHGDLWSGNKGYIDNGTPVIYDPACYYGDREVDIAMTRLFGDFNIDFYKGYESVWPLEGNHSIRQPLYNLYHQLNHLNLFGGSYLNSCVNTMASIIKQER